MKYSIIKSKSLKAIIFSLVLIISSFSVNFFTDEPIIKVAKAWWNNDWSCYKVCNINTNGYSGYYQMRINVSYNGGGDVSCEGHCQADFDDIRFVDIDNTTVLPYWKEKYVSGSYAIFWVNVSADAMSDGKILMYYGNSGASDASDGDATFLFFDDFDSGSNWTEIDAGAIVSISSSKITIEGTTDSSRDIRTINQYISKNVMLEAYGQHTADDTRGHIIIGFSSDTSGDYTVGDACQYVSNQRWSHEYLRWGNDGSGNSYEWGSDACDQTEWHIYGVYNILTKCGVMIDYDEKYSTTTDVPDQTNMYIVFGAGLNSDPAHQYIVDWVRIRKYSEPEPTWSSFGAEQTQGWINTPPSITSPNPANGSIEVQLQPTVSAYVSDADGNITTVDFYISTDGISWTHVQQNTSVLNETVSYVYSSATQHLTTYYWKVTANDGHDNTTAIYHFTTTYNHSLVWFVDVSPQYSHYKPYVKHPYGAYKNGLNIYLSSHTEDDANNLADPDWLCWFNETSKQGGWHEIFPAENVNTRNTGGQVAFADDGTIWIVWNGAWGNPSFNLTKSNAPYDIYNFTRVLSDWSSDADSTAVGIQIDGDIAYISWRHDGSTVTSSRSVIRRFNISSESWIDSSYTEVYAGGTVGGDTVGVEQQWLKFDSRFNKLTMGMIWLNVTPHTFFGDTFLCSDDGLNWYYANNSPASLPIPPSDGVSDKILSPWYIEKYTSLSRGWCYGENGLTPSGRPYVLTVTDVINEDEHINKWAIAVWNGTAWNLHNVTTSYQSAISVGITKDIMCIVYSNYTRNNTVEMIYSDDDGNTWSSPIKLFAISENKTIDSIVYVIPDTYNENVARFFFAYRNDTAPQTYYYAMGWFRVNLSSFVSVQQWNTIDIWNGNIQNTSSWHTIESWTGTVSNIASWNPIESWSGQLNNYSNWFTIEEWINNNIYNASSWNTIQIWTGSVSNSSKWKKIEEWVGELNNVSSWHTIVSWVGSIYNTSKWNSIESWNGILSNSSYWHLIESWQGNITNTSGWNIINTWSGQLYATSGWLTITSWSGYISNSSSWILITNFSGTISNTSSWHNIESLHGYLSNQSNWNLINSWYGNVSNTSSWSLIELWNGNIYNYSGWSLISSFNGNISNNSYWNSIDSWSGNVYNSSPWNLISSWGGSIYNATNPITIGSIQPENNSIHVDIINNPPDPGGYVNLSWQLIDSNGGGDMEFFMDIWNGTAWVNRLHLTDQSNGSWYHHETTFNKTGTTYMWRIHAKDWTTGIWTNETYTFRTDSKPNPPSNPSPANRSKVDAGDITLAVKVTHPDAGAGVKIYNVSFYEYPSGRLIGWNYSASGFANGTVVRCNTTFYAPYEGTKYYWYARAKDDEYWSDNSSIFYFTTNYTETEPNVVYYRLGADIYVQPVYTEAEPSVVYYSLGGQINILDLPILSNPQPANGSTEEWLSVKLSIDVNKSLPNATYWNISFLINDTVNGSWVVLKTIPNVEVNVTTTTVSVLWSGLDWNKTYYWMVSAYNATYDRYSNSSVFHFTTIPSDSEPNITYYSIGSQIYVQPVYDESEPDIVYYSLGADIRIFYAPVFYNASPDGTTDEWLSVPLAVYTNKSGNTSYWNFTFLTNDTVDGSWVEIGKINNVLVPNNTSLRMVRLWWSGLDWGKTYYWRVSAYNATLGVYSNSSVYSFTTRLNDTEPDEAIYSLGADIYVKQVYSEQEPDVVYYSIGAEMEIGKPTISNPQPANNTSHGKKSRYFSVTVNDSDTSDIIDKVEFYWSNGTRFGVVYNVSANSVVSVYVSNLTGYIWHYWYVKVYDGNWVVTSPTWSYRPANNAPVAVLSPANNSDNIAVYRKLVSGVYKKFVRLTWNITDADGDDLGFTLYVDDPTQAGIQWIMRWNVASGAKNGSYSHDEEMFNETGRTYWWKLVVTDGENTTTYIYSFFARFFIDIWWQPEYPTQEDNVKFYSLVKGANRYNWSFGDGHHSDLENTTHKYDYANFYNVTMSVFKDTYTNDTYTFEGGTMDEFIKNVSSGGHWKVDTDHAYAGSYSVNTSADTFDCDYMQFLLNNSTFMNMQSANISVYMYVVNNYPIPQSACHGIIIFSDNETQDWYVIGLTNSANDMRLTVGHYTNGTQYETTNFSSANVWATNNWYKITVHYEKYNATHYLVKVWLTNVTNGTTMFINQTYIYNPSDRVKYVGFGGLHHDDGDWIYFDNFYVENLSSVSGYKHSSLSAPIRVDRNITLHKTGAGAGINYVGWHLPNATTLEGIAENLSLQKGWWVHYYNKTLGRWQSYWVGYFGENVVIHQYGCVAITASLEHKARVNTTVQLNLSQNMTLTPVYNYIVWTGPVENVTNLTNYGLHAGDWVHYYDTVNGTWKSYMLGYTGTKFDIHPYDVLVLAVGGERQFKIS